MLIFRGIKSIYLISSTFFQALGDLILQSRDFQSLNGDPSLRFFEKKALSLCFHFFIRSPQMFFTNLIVISEPDIVLHCVKCVQTRSFSWSVFPRIRTE